MKTRTAALVAFLVLAAMAPAVTARAAVKVIPMDKFRQESPEPSSYIQNPAVVSVPPSASGTWGGYAKVRLPVGSVIEGVTYYRWSDNGSTTMVYFNRTRPPRGPETLGGRFDSSVTPDHDYHPVELEMATTADLVVRKGYVYYVTMFIYKGAGVSGVKVHYQPPPP